MYCQIVSLFTIAVLGFVHSGTVHRDASLGIIGGDKAGPNEGKFAARLERFITDKDTGEKIFNRCGGSLLSAKYVLTAKHCVQKIEGMYVHLGNHDSQSTDPAEVEVLTNNFITHDDADLALVVLDPPVQNSTTIEYATLPSKNSLKDYTGEVGTAYGWGFIHDNKKFARYLMKVDVPVIDNAQCDIDLAPHNPPRNVRDYEFCTAGKTASDSTPKGTCAYDSGGPFVINDVQVGIVAWGPGKCEAGAPSVYINTGDFLEWIEEHIRN